jgi:hypothetical protein
MATTTNYGWTTPDNTALVKDGASAIRTLGSSIDTTLKAQIDAQIPDTLLTTTGDVIYASAANTPARLGIGTTGQVLQVSGGLPAWGTAPSGGMTLISTTALTGASVTLSSIPSGYNHLYLLVKGVTPSATNNFSFRINGVSTANTYYQSTSNDVGTTAFGDNLIAFSNNTIPAAQNKNSFSTTFWDYSNTDNWKLTTADNFFQGVAVTTNFLYHRRFGLHNQTAAITSLVIFTGGGTFSAGTALLYGVK